MQGFDSWQSYGRFARITEREFRYVRDEVSERFLRTVREQADQRRRTLTSGQVLWRARLGSEWEEQTESNGTVSNAQVVPLPWDQMTPRTWCSTEGRANPKGIPYLYLSDEKDTAISELRPWIGTAISAAQFRLTKSQTVIDCSATERFTKIYFKEPGEQEKATAVWAHIDQAFAAPVTRDDTTAEYAPTQVLAEVFKAAGYDGIMYRSSVGAGHSIVLFDVEAAVVHTCCLYTVTALHYTFEQTSSPYVVKAERTR